jgi:peptidoglycan hydrolase-like protein with peptidoglycan-binding domain
MRLPRKLAAAPAMLVAVSSVLMGLSGSSAAAPAAAGAVRAAPVLTAAVAAPTTRPRFYRETVRYGASDTSPYQISHVYEVQIRLTWAGAYSGPITGYFGPLTLAGVKTFQRSQRMLATGVVDAATWVRLIRVSTIRRGGDRTLPAVCRSAGWHTCYSRSTHELFTFYSGTWWNAWLVRGGSYYLQTVLGTYVVYWQDIDHLSGLFSGAPMPYSQFFYGGEAIHGSATMMNPLVGHSHGCVNMYIEDAAELWRLTAGKRHVVTVYGRWA